MNEKWWRICTVLFWVFLGVTVVSGCFVFALEFGSTLQTVSAVVFSIVGTVATISGFALPAFGRRA